MMKRLIPFLFVFLFSMPLLANAQASNMTSGTSTVDSANTTGTTLSAGGTNFIGTQNNSNSSTTNTQENQPTNPSPPPAKSQPLPTQPLRIDSSNGPPSAQGNTPPDPPPRTVGTGRP